MSPIFKCLICRKDIERSTRTFLIKRGNLLCFTCLDSMDKKNYELSKLIYIFYLIVNSIKQDRDAQPNKSKIFVKDLNTTVTSY